MVLSASGMNRDIKGYIQLYRNKHGYFRCVGFRAGGPGVTGLLLESPPHGTWFFGLLYIRRTSKA